MRHFHTPQPLVVGQTLQLEPTLTHRLSKVLRLGQGAAIALFNGADGLFAAEISDPKARTAHLTSQLKPFTALPPLTLALCMPKREAWESALRQATELGVTTIQPLKSEFAQVGKLNLERAQSNLIEAAEQCERLCLPELKPLQTLPEFLRNLKIPTAWAYERQSTPPTHSSTPPSILLIGPEGGFSPAEVQTLQSHPHIQVISLGPTILRTDTAVVAGLARLMA